MTDHVVDTNVLLVASAAHPQSPFGDSHVPPDLQRDVLEWLTAFRSDSARCMVLDDTFRIYQEYRNRLTGQDYGLLVVHEKMTNFRCATLQWDGNGHAVVPSVFARFDLSDRKLLAAALTDRENINIVNASDTDWLEIEAELQAEGVAVEHLLESWLRAMHKARK